MNFKRSRKSLLCGHVSIVSLAALTTGLTYAEPVYAEDGETLVMDQIVVTARKREENLQDVPLSITQFDADALANRQINDLESVADYTAGLNFEDFVTTFNGLVTLRGLVQANIQNRVTNVAVFLDGVHIPRNYAVDVGLADLQRIEVVKGPQSALYGQNAFAGAINYATVRPSQTDFEADFSGTVGSAGRYEAKGAISIPIIRDKLAVRGFYGYSEFDGNRDNGFPVTVGSQRKLGGYERQSFSLALAMDPIDNVSIDLSYTNTSREEEVRPSYTVSGNRSDVVFNCGPLIPGVTPASPSFVCGELPTSADQFLTADSTRPPGILLPAQPASEIDSEIYRASFQYDITDQVTVNYIFGRVEAEGEDVAAINDDATQGFNSFQKEGGINTFTSHEIRLSYTPNDSLFGEVGFYKARNDDDFVFGLGFFLGAPDFALTNPTSGTLDLTGIAAPFNSLTREDRTNAVFGRLQYDITANARLAFEGRYAWEERTVTDNLAGGQTLSGDFNNFTPRITAEYDVSDDVLLYASAARGVKAGGFNGFTSGAITLIPEERSFDDETNWTYEIGAKTTLFGGRLIANLTAYYIDWSNMQITTAPTGFDTTDGGIAPTIFLNVGDVRNWGFELEGAAVLNDHWTFDYALSYSDPTFKDGTKWGQFVGVCDDIFCPADGDVSGLTLPRQSKLQGAFGAQFETPVTDDMAFFARTDYTYTSRQFVDALNLGWTPGRHTLGASVGVEGDYWKLTAWGKNLTDTTYATNSLFIVLFRRYVPALNDGISGGVTLTLRY